MKITALFPLLLLTASCSLMPAKRIYISTSGIDLNDGTKNRPLESPGAAQEAVRKIKSEHPDRNIRVIFGEGTWYLGKPLVFSGADGGSDQAKVTWQGAPNGGTVISGGRLITGFQDAGYGIWWADVDSAIGFEQLYVDGTRATRARTPNKSDSLPRFYLNKSHWVYLPDSSVQKITLEINDRGYFQDLMTSGEFEVVVFKDWTTSRFRASGLQAGPPEIYLKPPFALFDGPYNSIFAGSANRYSCFLEGDPAFLDEAGEWALDRDAHRLYYKPLPGQSIESTVIVAALTEQLVSIEGSRTQPVKNLAFENIAFRHAAYRLPEFSHDGAQACFYYPGKSDQTGAFRIITEAIRMKWADQCLFQRCSVSLTAGNGIFIEEGCHNNLIDNTLIEHIGGNGIMIGLPFDPMKDSSALPSGNSVSRVTLRAGGEYFQGAVGIWLGFGANNEVSDSEISDLPYTGISVGWQWNPLPTSSHGNRILNNRIHHVMQVLGDGGGIYTLGFQPGSLISGNDIHDILRSELNHASPNNGMFIDEGSKGYRIEGNTIRNTAHTCIRGHRTAGVELARNTFYPSTVPAISHTPPYDAMIFASRDTTIRWTNPGWPKEWGYADTVTAFTMHDNRFLINK